jgi:anti-anti-sigma factor
MQTKTKWHVDQLTSPAGHPVFVLHFDGDIAATSKEEFEGCYQSLPKESSKLILLDFSKVGYINSSGITLVIQLLMEANHHVQKVYAFGLSPHFTKVFTVAGITKYAQLFRTQTEAIASF